MPDSINRISALLLIAFALLIGALGYWAASGPSLTAREDNPRRVLDERRILRGAILDRDGAVIVQTVGQPGAYARHTLYPDAAPFIGYYSINYGTSGVEQAFDGTLRGTAGVDPLQARVDRLLHVSPSGRAVQLTIDLDVQRTADALLAKRGRTGAIVVLSVPAGDILALSSQPTFDPNTLDDNWDTLRANPSAPLLNRATQGQYQPGTALQPILLGEALRRGAAALDDTPEFPVSPLRIDGRELMCRDTTDVVTLVDAFRAACPAPFADLGAVLGSDALWNIAARWGLTATNATGIQSTAPITRSLPLTDTRALREFAAGQGPLTMTPLQMAVVAAALAARGEMPAPRIVSGTQSIAGSWQLADRSLTRRVLPSGTGEQVAAAMRQSDNLAWHAGIGLSGPARLLWFIGFTPIDRPKYAIAVLIEAGADELGSDQDAFAIGQVLLTALPR
ncbi:MAG: penicillin-binding transpeptidase domain-containing protein [Anaerolineae bacterium]